MGAQGPLKNGLGPHRKQALDDGNTDGQERQRQAEEEQNRIARDSRQPRAHPGNNLGNSIGYRTKNSGHASSLQSFTPSTRNGNE